MNHALIGRFNFFSPLTSQSLSSLILHLTPFDCWLNNDKANFFALSIDFILIWYSEPRFQLNFYPNTLTFICLTLFFVFHLSSMLTFHICLFSNFFLFLVILRWHTPNVHKWLLSESVPHRTIRKCIQRGSSGIVDPF